MKILLIDDHVLFREGVTLLLGRLGADIEVLEAGSCEEALRRLENASAVDLVMMDIGLPGMSGLDGISLIRERFPELPVVVLSSSDDLQTVLRALDLGAMGFIPKSSSSDVMLGALRLILANGIYLPPSVFLADGQIPRRPTVAAAPASPDDGAYVTPSQLGLTGRQADVLRLILQGKPAKSISRELGLSPSTVKSHTSAVLRALNVTTRTQAVIAAGKRRLKF